MLIPLIFIGLFLTLALTDALTRRIPHTLTLPALGFALICAPHLPSTHPLNAALGLLTAGGLFWLIRITSTRYYKTTALGFGDVTLAALIGAVGGLYDGLLALAIGMLISGGIALFYRYRLHLGSFLDTFPYGVGLALGASIRYLFWLLAP